MGSSFSHVEDGHIQTTLAVPSRVRPVEGQFNIKLDGANVITFMGRKN
jgi:hypothetical protein